MQGESNVKLVRKIPSDKSFGFALAIVAGLLSFIQLFRGNYTQGFYYSLGAAVLLLITLLFAKGLNPLNRVWFVFSGILGSVVSPLVMGILYFLIIVPVGMVMKLKVTKKQNNTNWKNISRNIDANSLNRQF